MGLRAELDFRLPEGIWPGQTTRVFCCGTAAAGEPIDGVELLVDGAARRPDRELPIGGRDRNAVRFWAALPLLPRGRGPVILEVRVRFASGANATAKLGEIAIEDPPNPLRTSDSPDELIAVCLATFDPEPELLRRQLESLRAQSDGGWICIVSDDCSRPERLALLEAEIEGDPHFLLSRSERRLGFYRNFERVLRLAPKRAPLLALCDQDDRWHPDKLATLRDAIGSRPLACSDARLTDGRGGVVSEELWPGRRFESASLASCLISNAIPGASMLLRREVAELALPFPSVPGWAFHDRWLAAVATALGPVAYVDRPLYDYVQHSGGVLGGWVGKHAAAGGRATIGRAPPRPERWRGRCFYVSEPVRVYALALGDRVETGGRRGRELRRLSGAASGTVTLGWLLGRLLRPLIARNETDGTERILLTGILWERVARLSARLGHPVETAPPAVDPAAISAPGPGRVATAIRRLRRGRRAAPS